jgi:hypothetical protein
MAWSRPRRQVASLSQVSDELLGRERSSGGIGYPHHCGEQPVIFEEYTKSLTCLRVGVDEVAVDGVVSDLAVSEPSQ